MRQACLVAVLSVTLQWLVNLELEGDVVWRLYDELPLTLLVGLSRRG
jgi:hypothetical protein